MAEFPAMRLWTDAYLADTTHLTCIEHGAYLLLLMTAWRSKTHLLPNDDKLLARYCRLNQRQWKRVRPRLEPFFKIEGGVWVNGRLLDELHFARQQQGQRADAGRASALKRRNRDATGVGISLNGNSTPIPIPIKKEENGLSGKEEEFRAYPGSAEFAAWKEYSKKAKKAFLAGELEKCELARIGFTFEARWPPSST